MLKFLRKNKIVDGDWLKVSDLKVGMQIAVPKDEILGMHQNGQLGNGSSSQRERQFREGDDVLWDEIESIEYVGTEQVWDIEVEGTHNFVGNNIFAHNTYMQGNLGIGVNPSTAQLHLAASSGAASTAPIKLTAGTDLTTPEAGVFEYDGTNLHFTPGVTRKTIAYSEDITTTLGSYVPYTGATGAVNLGSNTITSGLINGQTISSAANFTGSVTLAGGNLILGANTLTTTNTTVVTNLNADKLDGLDATSFTASGTDNWVNTTGDTMSGDLTFSNGRKALVGVYDAAQTQAIFAMGSPYVLTDGGASTNYGNFYGIAWSYNPDYGTAGNNPQSKAGLNHQALFMNAGVTQTAIGTGIWTSGNITGANLSGTNTGDQSLAGLQSTISLTTTGTSGAATLVGSILNIPQYGGGGIGYPTSAGIVVSTGSGWGTSITDASANWNTAFNQTRQWDGGATGLVATTGRASLGLGTLATLNDAPAGTLTGGTLNSTVLASSLTSVGTLGSLSVTGAITSGLINGQTISSAANFTGSVNAVGNITGANLSGSNTGDQNLSGLQATLVSGTNIKTINSISLLGAGDIVITGGVAWGAITGTLSAQTDLQNAFNLKANLASPTFTGTVGGINATMVGLGNVPNLSFSGSNTGDQTLSGLGGQPQLNGLGFVRANGTSISYDNSDYLSKNQAITDYIPYTGGNTNVDLGVHKFTVDTDTLFVDSGTNTVSIGPVSTGYKLNIADRPSANTPVVAIDNTSVGTTANAGLLISAGNDTGVNASKMIAFLRPDNTVIGSISQNAASTVAYNTSSDRRIKRDITPTNYSLEDLLKIQVTDFSYINDPSGQMTTGFIAQDLEKIFPGAVTTNGDNGTDVLGSKATPWMIDYGRITPLIIKSIQDLNLKIEDLALIPTDQIKNSNTFGINLVSFFNDVVLQVDNGVAYMKGLVVDTLKIGSPTKRTGITLYDEITGNPYCLSIANGATKTIQGECVIIESSANTASAGSATPPLETEGQGEINLPVITLNGASDMTLEVGSSYEEEGATVIDDVDTYVAVNIGGSIDTTIPGTYTITYNAIDTEGNNAIEIKRTIIVNEIIPSLLDSATAILDPVIPTDPLSLVTPADPLPTTVVPETPATPAVSTTPEV